MLQCCLKNIPRHLLLGSDTVHFNMIKKFQTQRQHDEAVKEVNQAMTVRIKASKDMKRLTEERNAAMQEYSLIMSERDAVHKEIEKLQEEVKNTKMRMTGAEHKNREWEEERRKMLLQVE